jgi:peptidoglycan hydrolase CwlO-like protein
MRKFLEICAIILVAGLLSVKVFADSQSDIEQTIANLEQTIAGLQSQTDTLSKQITLLNSQITLTTLQIDDTKRKITALDTEITQLDGAIVRLEDLKTQRLELVLHRIPQSYKRSVASQFGWLLFSTNFTDLVTRAKYLAQLQEEDTQLYQQYQLTQNEYNDSKDTREKKKAEQVALNVQLVQKTTQLAQQKGEKQSLLTQTQGEESQYQTLLAQARAQLAGFASFASSQGGGLLSGQTHCDSWGCYYNQRDSQWGNMLINGQNDCGGACSISRVGCLITSIAMVASHMGHNDITPADIASSDPNNFSVGTAMLRYTINVKGVTISRTSTSLSPDSVKDQPVIVGIRWGAFGTHFVVIKSYDGSHYIMNDPYQDGGHDKVFTDSYSLGSVFEVDRVSI